MNDPGAEYTTLLERAAPFLTLPPLPAGHVRHPGHSPQKVHGGHSGGGPAAGTPAAGGPGSGRDLIGGGGGDAAAADMLGAARRHEYPSGNGGPRGDEKLRQISERQGFDGKPRVVSKSQMDGLVGSGHIEMHRGVQDGWDFEADPDLDVELSGSQMLQRFRHGNMRFGEGQHGNGTYASTNRRIAQDYAGGSGAIARMALHPQAKVVRWRDLESDHERFIDSLPAGSPQRRLYGDPGRYAAARGFDAILIAGSGTSLNSGDEYNVLNRTALAVEEG